MSRKKQQTPTKHDLYGWIVAYDGMEVPRDLWPLAEELVNDGLIFLGHARGPGRDFRRAEALIEYEEEGAT